MTASTTYGAGVRVSDLEREWWRRLTVGAPVVRCSCGRDLHGPEEVARWDSLAGGATHVPVCQACATRRSS
jgi:hypothetical protein